MNEHERWLKGPAIAGDGGPDEEPIVTDGGGLPEACAAAAEVGPWMDLVQRLEDDPSFYAAQRTLALEAGRAYSKQTLQPRYFEFFQSV